MAKREWWWRLRTRLGDKNLATLKRSLEVALLETHESQAHAHYASALLDLTNALNSSAGDGWMTTGSVLVIKKLGRIHGMRLTPTQQQMLTAQGDSLLERLLSSSQPSQFEDPRLAEPQGSMPQIRPDQLCAPEIADNTRPGAREPDPDRHRVY